MQKPNVIPASEMKNIFPGTSDQYWATLRHKGTGPAYVKVNRKVYYDTADVAAWVDSNRFDRPDKPVTNAQFGGGDAA